MNKDYLKKSWTEGNEDGKKDIASGSPDITSSFIQGNYKVGYLQAWDAFNRLQEANSKGLAKPLNSWDEVLVTQKSGYKKIGLVIVIYGPGYHGHPYGCALINFVGKYWDDHIWPMDKDGKYPNIEFRKAIGGSWDREEEIKINEGWAK